MSCDITSGITRGCNSNIGGIDRIFIRNEAGNWREWELSRQTANLVETFNINQAGGIVGYTQALTIHLKESQAQDEGVWAENTKKLAQANNLEVLVIPNNNLDVAYRLFGRGGYLASGEVYSGTLYSDRSGATFVIQADSKQPMEIVDWRTYIFDPFLDVELTRVEELGICNFYPAPAGNGYLQFNQVNVDQYSFWNQYNCDEVWGGTGHPIPFNADIYITGHFTLRVDAGTQQSDWDVLYNSALGVNTSNSGNFPPHPDEPVFFNMSDYLPAVLPAVGYTKRIDFTKNIGPLNVGSSLNNQSFGIMIVNQLADRPPVTGPWTANIKQIGGQLTATLV